MSYRSVKGVPMVVCVKDVVMLGGAHGWSSKTGSCWIEVHINCNVSPGYVIVPWWEYDCVAFTNDHHLSNR